MGRLAAWSTTRASRPIPSGSVAPPGSRARPGPLEPPGRVATGKWNAETGEGRPPRAPFGASPPHPGPVQLGVDLDLSGPSGA